MKQYLSFGVDSELYMLSISQVHSIIKKAASEIRSLPDAPPFFLGLTQLRETTIGILSASVLFNKHSSDKEELDVIIIKTDNEELYGIVVDIVYGVKTIEPDDLQSNDMMSQLNQYVLNVYQNGDELNLVIDANRLIEIKNVKEVYDEN